MVLLWVTNLQRLRLGQIALYQLCDLGPITYPLCLRFLIYKMGMMNIHLMGRLGGVSELNLCSAQSRSWHSSCVMHRGVVRAGGGNPV